MKSRRKILGIPLGISLIVLCVGSYLRIQHNPLGYEISAIGSIALAVIYCLRFIAKDDKTLTDVAKFVMLLVWVITLILALNQHWYFYLLLALLILAVAWIMLELRSALFQKNVNDKINPILWIATLIMAIEFLCRVKSWPIVWILLLLGLVTMAIGFFVDAWSQRKALIKAQKKSRTQL